LWDGDDLHCDQAKLRTLNRQDAKVAKIMLLFLAVRRRSRAMAKLSAILALVGAALLALSFTPSLQGTFTVPPVLTPTADAAHGQALFQAKGCASCHAHRAVAHSRSRSYNIGPNLTNCRADPDFLRRWLRDPQAIRPNTAMPNLHLSDDEIEALIAFLSEGNRR
jgi:cytochrome c2